MRLASNPVLGIRKVSINDYIKLFDEVSIDGFMHKERLVGRLMALEDFRRRVKVHEYLLTQSEIDFAKESVLPAVQAQWPSIDLSAPGWRGIVSTEALKLLRCATKNQLRTLIGQAQASP